MARVNNLNNFLIDVASAIKTKKGSEVAIPAANFDTEILALPSQGTYEQRVLNISKNGTQTITPSEGFDAIDELELTVAVPEKQLQSKTYNFTQNTAIQLLPDTGYDGFDVVTLNIEVPGEEINNQDKEITENGVYTADEGYTGLGTVTVNVPQTGDVPVKLFETEEQMQADTTAKEGDLAIVYGIREIGVSYGMESITKLSFPEVVVLPETVASNYSWRSSGSIFDMTSFELTATRFKFSNGRLGGTSVSYTSEDGVTYTRTTTITNPVTLKSSFSINSLESSWTNLFSYFALTSTMAFEGLYKHNSTEYVLADTQFNLSKANELLSGVSAYGKTGVITGDGSIYSNLNWNDIPSTSINTSYLVKTLDAICNAPSCETYKTDGVKNKIYSITSGENEFELRCDFNLSILIEYLVAFDLQLDAVKGHFTYDYNTGNLYYTTPYSELHALVVIYNLFTRKISHIDIALQHTDINVGGEVVIDMTTGESYYVSCTGYNNDLSMNADRKLECYKLNVDTSAYEFMFYFSPTTNSSNIKWAETLIRNGKVYLSYFSTDTQKDYIYVYKEGAAQELLTLSKASSLNTGHFLGYLSDRSSIQVDNIRYFMTYNDYSSSTLYRLDMNTDVITKLVTFNNYNVSTPSDGGSTAWNSTTFLFSNNKLYGCNYIHNGTAWYNGNYNVNVFVYDIEANTINVLPFTDSVLGNSQSACPIETVYLDADLINNKVVFRLAGNKYLLNLEDMSVSKETVTGITYPTSHTNTKFKLDNRSYTISGKGNGLYNILRVWNCDITNLLLSDVHLISEESGYFSPITIDKPKSMIYADTITPEEYNVAVATSAS